MSEENIIDPTMKALEQRSKILNEKIEEMYRENVDEKEIYEYQKSFYENELLYVYMILEGFKEDAIYNNVQIRDHFDFLDIDIIKQDLGKIKPGVEAANFYLPGE